jgi:hypothetical protein
VLVSWGGPEPVRPVSLVPYPKPCTLHHSVTSTLVLRAITPVGPTTWGPKLEKRRLSPGVVRNHVAAQPGPVPWACMFHHSVIGVLVSRTTIQGVATPSQNTTNPEHISKDEKCQMMGSTGVLLTLFS